MNLIWCFGEQNGESIELQAMEEDKEGWVKLLQVAVCFQLAAPLHLSWRYLLISCHPCSCTASATVNPLPQLLYANLG